MAAAAAATDARVNLPGSKRIPWPGAQKVGTPRMDEVVDLTVWLRPRHGGDLDAVRAHTLSTLAPRERTYLSRKELREATAADSADVDRLSAFLARHKISRRRGRVAIGHRPRNAGRACERFWRDARALCRPRAAAVPPAFGDDEPAARCS